MAFVQLLGIYLKTALESKADILDALESLEIIEATPFDQLTDTWRTRAERAIEDYTGRTGGEGVFSSFDQPRR